MVSLDAWRLAMLALFTVGCGRGDVHGGRPVAAAADLSAAEPAPTPTRLDGRLGSPSGLWIEVSYKIRHDEDGQRSKALKIDIEGAEPGVKHALSLDGFSLGSVITDIEGEGEFELVEEGDDYFPEGFVEPKEGSVVRAGDLGEIRLLPLVKLTDLRLDIVGPGELTGRVDYEIERLGDEVTTDFQVKLEHAGGGGVHPVLLDGEHVGDVRVDLDGKAKLLYSTLDGEPFPPDFHVPHPGSRVEIGQLCEGRLRDDLARPGE